MPKRTEERLAVILVLAFVLLLLAFWEAVDGASPPSAATAERYLEEAKKLLAENKFQEAATKYYAASQEYAKIPREKKKAQLSRAHSHFYQGLATYQEMDMTGIMRDSYIEGSINAFEAAAGLYREIGNKIGAEASDGWRVYLLGVRNDLHENYAVARANYEKAFRTFLGLLEAAPEARETIQGFVSIAERGIAFSTAMEVMSDVERMRTRGGEINQLLEAAKKTSTPEFAPYWEALKLFIKGQRQFWDGADLLERWDHKEARKVFSEAERSFTEGAGAFAKLSKGKGNFPDMVQGYRYLNEGKKHETGAMAYLLEEGNPGRAKGELLLAVENFRRGQDTLEKAGTGSPMIASVRSLYDKLRQRALAVSQAYGLKNVTIDVGKWFVLFFFLTFSVLSLSSKYLKLSGRLILWTSLLVAIIGGFGLKSPEILSAFKEMKLP